ncbi:MAG TPA: hypothetical protein IAA29_09855 [Candidatus Paenibacillus intestinavium]|nr:hypothetical protein [Candidatus Paenibacillus intestinavium]
MKKIIKAMTTRLALFGMLSLMLTGATSLVNPQVVSANSNLVTTGKNSVVFTMDSKKITFNNTNTTTDIPISVIKGVSYIQFKTIAKIYGFNVSYDAKTKSSIASIKNKKISFKQGSTNATLNGKNFKATGAPYAKDGSLMVPIRTWADMTGSKISVNGKKVTLNWDSAPSANFVVNEKNIIAGETNVTITDNSSSPYGYAIIAEEWVGKQTVYNEPGKYTISHWVQDERGIWSAPYNVVINVLKANEAPIAAFVTDKDTYKLGEPIVYTNQSTDDTAITGNTWANNEPAFFTPGKHTINLTVQDGPGLKSTVSKEITVLDEIMYTKEQFYLNFTNSGSKFPIESSLALGIAPIPYTITPEDITITRTNSPERLLGPAIDYIDTLSGKVRFNIHKQNSAEQDLELHLIVTNENAETVYIDKDYFGAAGPAQYVTTSGKTAVKRYLQQLLDSKPAERIAVQPGESVDLIPDGILSPIKKNQTMTIFAEYTVSDNLPLKFTLVATEKDTDEIAALATLQQSEHDTKHVRGTFANGNRVITADKVLGENGADKLILGDKGEKAFDQLLQGIDAITGEAITNWGNGGVLYKLQLEVAPNTAIVLNPRGGHYGGSFIVNDKVVELLSNSILTGPTEAGFLHRTGSKQESVTLMFLVSPGSNMPLNLLFLPLPSLTTEVEASTDTTDTTDTTSESTETTDAIQE